MSRYCPQCKRVLDLDRFYVNSRGYCKECHREYNRQRRKDAGRMRKATARRRFYRQLDRIRDNPNLSEAGRREERLIAVEDAMRVRHSWFDQLLSAEAEAKRAGAQNSTPGQSCSPIRPLVAWVNDANAENTAVSTPHQSGGTPMSKTKERKYRFQILTAGEIEALDSGPTRVMEIAAVPAKEATTRTQIVRGPQQLKDICIQDFAEAWCTKAEKYKPTAADLRHLDKLIALIDRNAEALQQS